jgi:hypothetical protein
VTDACVAAVDVSVEGSLFVDNIDVGVYITNFTAQVQLLNDQIMNLTTKVATLQTMLSANADQKTTRLGNAAFTPTSQISYFM